MTHGLNDSINDLDTFLDQSNEQRNREFEKLTAGKGQLARELPGNWRCFTEAEVQSIISAVKRNSVL